MSCGRVINWSTAMAGQLFYLHLSVSVIGIHFFEVSGIVKSKHMYFLPHFDLYNYTLFYHKVCINAKKNRKRFHMIIDECKEKEYT